MSLYNDLSSSKYYYTHINKFTKIMTELYKISQNDCYKKLLKKEATKSSSVLESLLKIDE